MLTKVLFPLILLPPLLKATPQNPNEPKLAPRDIKLVEFGWGIPSASYLADNPNLLKKRPFDGVVFKPTDGNFHRGASQVPILFDDRPWTETEVGFPAVKKLNLPESYLILQASTLDANAPDPAGWLSDTRWKTIEANLRLYAKARAASGAKGFFLDEEPYVANPWQYNEKRYPDHSFDQVKAAVRKRGRTFMTALQSSGDDLTLVPIFGLCSTKIGGSKNSLTPSFYDGWLDVIAPTTRIIDGNENGYYHAMPGPLHNFRQGQFAAAELLAPENQKKYLKHLGTGHGFYTDLNTRPEAFGNFFFTQRLTCFIEPADRPAFVRHHLYNHARMADDLVWLWTERYDWWRPEGQRTSRAKQSIPPWFEKALIETRQHIRKGTRPKAIPEILTPALNRQQNFIKKNSQ